MPISNRLVALFVAFSGFGWAMLSFLVCVMAQAVAQYVLVEVGGTLPVVAGVVLPLAASLGGYLAVISSCLALGIMALSLAKRISVADYLLLESSIVIWAVLSTLLVGWASLSVFVPL